MNDFIAFIPIIVLIAGALITKRIAECIIFASVLGAVFVHKENFFNGFIEMIYGTLANPSYQFVLIILVGFGAMIKLFQESGAMIGFGTFLSKYAKGPKTPLLIAWAMAFIMFVDDYLSTLAISFTMKEITDRCSIPREHLAYQTNAMAACICVVLPFSSWTAFTVGLASDEGLGYSDYIAGIPFMFYPILTILICLLVDIGIVPKFGMLKESYERVQNGGPVFIKDEIEGSIIDIEDSQTAKESHALNVIIPIIVLVVTVLLCDNDLAHGLVATIAVQGILYVAQRIMTIKDVFDYIFEGAKSMATLAVVICCAFMLSAANKELGFFEILINGISGFLSPTLLPVLVFIVVAFTVFATSGYWLMQVLAIPIFIPLAFAMNVNPAIILAAIMSGVTLGCNICFYCDPVFMTAAGTGVSNLKLVKVSLPYLGAAAILTAIGYLIVGFIC